MVRRFIWVSYDQSISNSDPQFGIFSEAAAMQAIADAGMSLCVHINELGGEYYVSSNGTYRRSLLGPLVPDSYGNSNLAIDRVLCQRSYYNRGRVVVNSSVNEYWLDDRSGRRTYIIEYTASQEYVINPETTRDSEQYLYLNWSFDIESVTGATVPDLSELKIWAISRDGIPWDLEWPRGSGIYGKRPPVQFTGSGGTIIYQNNDLVPTDEITVQKGLYEELVLGEVTAGLDLENYYQGFGFNSDSWLPLDVSVDSAKPPLFWEIVSGIDYPDIPGVALLPCVPSPAGAAQSLFVVSFSFSWEFDSDNPLAQSPHWEPNIDPYNYDERRIVVFDIFNPTGCYSKIIQEFDPECMVVQLSSDGLGLYNYENLVKNTVIEVPLSTLADIGLDVANTRPMVISKFANALATEYFFMNGFFDCYGVFLTPVEGAESTFWKSHIKTAERI